MPRNPKKLFIASFVLTLLFGGLFFASTVWAQDLGIAEIGETIGLGSTDIRLVIAKIIRAVLGFLGIIVLCLMLYAGFIWMTAGGNEEKVTEAKTLIKNSLIGLVIILSAFAITSFVIKSLARATGFLPAHCYNGVREPESGEFREGEGPVDRGGECGEDGPNGCPNPAGCDPKREFQVELLPPNGDVCIRNYHPVVVFSEPPNLDSLNNSSFRIVYVVSTSEKVEGVWSYVADTNDTAVKFTPNGDCGDAGADDCFDAGGKYELMLPGGRSDGIKTRAGYPTQNEAKNLSCSDGEGCGPVDFTAGSGVDRTAPTITISAPDSAFRGEDVSVNVTYNDDFGLQNALLYVGDSRYSQDDETFTECKKTDSFTLTWKTSGWRVGNYNLRVLGTDWAAFTAEVSRQIDLRLEEAQCVAGNSCSKNSDCCTGFCAVSVSGSGVCERRLEIRGLDPNNGAPGNYVSINGRYFGSEPGKVYFVSNINGNPSLYADGPLNNSFSVSQAFSAGKATRTNLNSSLAHTGEKMIKIDKNVSDGWVYLWSAPIENIKSSESYLGSVYAYSPTVGAQLFLTISFDGGKIYNFTEQRVANTGECVGSRNSDCVLGFPLSSGWRKYEYVLKNHGQNDTNKLYFKWGLDQYASVRTATVYLDDFNMQKIGGGPIVWQEAQLPCDPKRTWTDNQIIAQVPTDAQSGPIKVEAAVDGRAGSSRTDITDNNLDLIKDNWGLDLDFIVNTSSRPGLCRIAPSSSTPGSDVYLEGNHFGVNGGEIYFGETVAAMKSGTNWFADNLWAVVPQLGSGAVGVKIKRHLDNAESNSIRFTVKSGSEVPESENSDVVITGISPRAGATNEYVFITGRNFGESPGVVWFRKDGDGAVVANGQVYIGDNCGDTWTNEKILIKIPSGLSLNQKYSVQVKPNNRNVSSIDLNNDYFEFVGGEPAPGICALSNYSGPIPYPDEDGLKIFGDHFLSDDDTVGISTTIFFSRNKVAEKLAITDNEIKVSPVEGTVSGAIEVRRASDNKVSNQVDFTVQNCLENTNACNKDTEQCCGRDTGQPGVCIAGNLRCKNDTLSTGYMWRFSTAGIPEPLRVVERCDASVMAGLALPSPSPSLLWRQGGGDPQENVCRGALISIEFSRADINLINTNVPGTDLNALVVLECTGGIDAVQQNCLTTGVAPTKVSVVNTGDSRGVLLPGVSSQSGANSQHAYLSLRPTSTYNHNTGHWIPNTWYQVKLYNNIRANGTGASSTPIIADRPCGDGTAYCFAFHTDPTGRQCELEKVIVTPYEYWTNHLEELLIGRTASGREYDLFYRGNGLSTDRCIMMDVSGYGWNWRSGNIAYSNIVGTTTMDKAQVSALQNTVGVNLTNPLNAVNIFADATTNTASVTKTKTGTSTLTIDLSDPKVVDYWPQCFEACPSAEIGVKFNISMSTANLDKENGAVRLDKCNDVNCFTTEPVTLADVKNQPDKSLIILTPETDLEQSKYYVVSISNEYPGELSSPATAPDVLWSLGNIFSPSSYSKPFNKNLTWKFRTKDQACLIDRVDVAPEVFSTRRITDKSFYFATPYSAPDACSAQGQRLNAYDVGWNWQSSDTDVATVTPFRTLGQNKNCTDRCVRKGSDVPFATTTSGAVDRFIACGNGTVEAGEDCDLPSATGGCTLTCLYSGNTNTTNTTSTVDIGLCGDSFVSSTKGEECDPGSADITKRVNCNAFNCLWTGSTAEPKANNVNASVCGDRKVTVGEECDVAIPPDDILMTTSSRNCSAQCLHTGTRMTNYWFQQPGNERPAGFATTTYDFYKNVSYSQCGDGVTSADEDPECEASFLDEDVYPKPCNKYCQMVDYKVSLYSTDGWDFATKPLYAGACVFGEEGCNISDYRPLGSSLSYSNPSVCGDGITGTGEVDYCESTTSTDFIKYSRAATTTGLYRFDPWVLAKGVGMGATGTNAVGAGVAQVALISATTNQNTAGGSGTAKTDSGRFEIKCGYQNDDECVSVAGLPNDNTYGVGNNSCCYARPQKTANYPLDDADDVCLNTSISASFDHPIDKNSITGNFLIARQLLATSTCYTGGEDVTELVVAFENQQLSWPKRLLKRALAWFNNLFGRQTASADVWCVGGDTGAVEVNNEFDPDTKLFSTSTLKVNLNRPLSADADYTIILKNGLKDTRGVSIGAVIRWSFETGNEICEVENISLSPTEVYFARANATTTMHVTARTDASRGNQIIAPIANFYAWDYIWGPAPSVSNPFVEFAPATTSASVANGDNILKALNKNGEIDVYATANVVANQYTARRGPVATGQAHAIVFLCENPWPPKDLPSNGARIFPYEDKLNNDDGFNLATDAFDGSSIDPSTVEETNTSGYYNFRTYYCADSGVSGRGDDLPYLRAAVQTSTAQLEVAKGACSFTGEECDLGVAADEQCNAKFTVTTTRSVFYSKYSTKICRVAKAPAYDSAALYYLDKNNSPLSCTNQDSCDDDDGFKVWKDTIPSDYDSTICSNLIYPSLNFEDPVCIAQPQLLKRFIFTDTNSRGVSDAVGISVFSNQYFLSPRDWLAGNKQSGGKDFNVNNFRDLKVGGYDAVSDGNNVYVEALNYSAGGSANLKSNIYLFSLNKNSGATMKNVFEQFMNNLTLNTNLTNTNYCVDSLEVDPPVLSPDSVPCRTDIDCASAGHSEQKCANQIDKLKRNYNRLRGLGAIEKSLANYADANAGKYPPLPQGTYLSGQTVSTWPSWSVLGTATGRSLPTDPINRLAPAGSCAYTADNIAKFCHVDTDCDSTITDNKCLLHDATTNWLTTGTSTADRRFSFACDPTSLAYRYIVSTSSPNYMVRYLLEPKEYSLSYAFNALIPKFIVTTSRFVSDPTGICLASEEISTMQSGFCGDGKLNLNLGEDCDPPQALEYGNVCTGGTRTLKTCSANCKWEETEGGVDCLDRTKCGNGKLDLGESCDDGVLNGRYGKCNNTCEATSTLYCGNGALDEPYEFCDTVSSKCAYATGAGVSTPSPYACSVYAMSNSYSCKSDCSGFGSYCGDGVIDASQGEECDGEPVCSVGGSSGVRNCLSCRKVSALAEWGMDNLAGLSPGSRPASGGAIRYVYPFSGDKFNLHKIFSVINVSSTATGDFPQYPQVVSDGKIGGAFKNSYNKRLFLYTSSTLPNYSGFEITGTSSISLWINPDDHPWDSVNVHRFNTIIEKGGMDTNNCGFTLRRDISNNDLLFYAMGAISSTYSARCSVADNYERQPGGGARFAGSPDPLTISGAAPPNTWTHLVVVNNSASARVYVNGVLKITTSKPLNNLTDCGNYSFGADNWYGSAINYVNIVGGYTHSDHTHPYSGSTASGSGCLTSSGAIEGDWMIPKQDWYFYYGKMDELKYFDRALSTPEVKDLFDSYRDLGGWMCTASTTPNSGPVAPTGCGNGHVESETEACDNSQVNAVTGALIYNNNGQTCRPGYNRPCTYCSADCRNVIRKEASGWCGDGVINTSSPERCENVGINTYSSVTGTNIYGTITDDVNGYHVYRCDQLVAPLNVSTSYWANLIYQTNLEQYTPRQIGDRKCNSSCSEIQDNCVACGKDNTNGVAVSGNIINVIEPSSIDPIYDYLYAGTSHSGLLELFYSKPTVNYSQSSTISLAQMLRVGIDSPTASSYALREGGNGIGSVKVNSDLRCSIKDDNLAAYYLTVNGYRAFVTNTPNAPIRRKFFPVRADSTPADFDLLLSPRINASSTQQKGHIRVVLSWVGDASKQLSAGFVTAINGGNTVVAKEGTDFNSAIGRSYFTETGSNFLKQGIWYHGITTTASGLNMESFTINTNAMGANPFIFYVRTDDDSAINYYRNNGGVKVEVYEPDFDTNIDYASDSRFSFPVRTFELKDARQLSALDLDYDPAIDDNPNASAWHVFNIKSLYPNPVASAEVSLEENLNYIRSSRNYLRFSY